MNSAAYGRCWACVPQRFNLSAHGGGSLSDHFESIWGKSVTDKKALVLPSAPSTEQFAVYRVCSQRQQDLRNLVGQRTAVVQLALHIPRHGLTRCLATIGRATAKMNSGNLQNLKVHSLHESRTLVSRHRLFQSLLFDDLFDPRTEDVPAYSYNWRSILLTMILSRDWLVVGTT